MKIKILKGEYLFSNEGLHICDVDGFAIKADQDVECDVNEEHVERVKELLKLDRLNKGLDEDGNPILLPELPEVVLEEPTIHHLVIESPAPSEE